MNDKKISKDFLLNNPEIMESLYDDFRVVDPIRKKVLFYNTGAFIESKESCFSADNKDKLCDNCISIRALNNKSTYVKIENIGKKVFIITAVPLHIKNQDVIVELIKDITNSFYYEECAKKEDLKFNKMIEDMKKIVNEDSLTEIYNRRYIDEKLPIDMHNCTSNNEPISIILADVDYYKDINDKFGHLTGDYVLRKFAKRLKKCIRTDKDWIARYGGDEFLVCIPGANEKLAFEVAERMHDYINNKEVHYNNKKIKITASFGICTIHDNSITKEEFINRADEKLYLAKTSGRNRIVF